MEFNTYQNGTKETRLPTASTVYLVTGLAAECGEVSGVFAKYIRDGYTHDEYVAKMEKEIGDVLWFLSELCTDCGIELDHVAAMNLAKLRRRQVNMTLQGSGDDR